MAPALIALAVQIGAPLVRRVLERRIGGENAELATSVLTDIAGRVGVGVEDLDRAAVDQPGEVTEAIAAVEREMPEKIALYAEGLRLQQEVLAREDAREPFWAWGWRPVAMWGFGFLWFWNIVILHVANAYWKIALPQTDLGTLFALNSVYMGLYMGGHTVKDFVASRWGAAK